MDHETLRARIDRSAVTLRAAEAPTLPLPGGPRAAPQQQLGRYPVVGHLGAGGMGEVVAVDDGDLGREVAAKVIRGEVSERALDKFILEARVTGQLEHPNIVPIYELAAADDGTVFFTMKRVAGDDLAALLAGGDARTSLPERLRIFLKVCDALSFAHSRGVLHRDLKPGNIMVGAHGEVLVMDWGLAKLLDAPADERDAGLAPRPISASSSDEGSGDLQTMDGTVLGTPAYMPPEQARGEIADLDPRADVYSLGAILYEMLTLRVPFEGGSPWDLLVRVADGALVPPRQRTPEREIPWELEAVVLRAMALEPAARYPDVAALAADVERFLTGGMLAAARYTTGQRLARWVRQHRAAVAGAVAVVAAVVASIVALTAHQRRQQETAARQLVTDAAALGVTLEPLLAAWTARHAAIRAGREGRETFAQQEQRQTALGRTLESVSLLDRALSILRDDDTRARRVAAGRRLARLAAIGGNGALARQAIRDLEALRVPSSKLTAWVDKALRARPAARVARVEAILADVRADVARADRDPTLPSVQGYIDEVAGYRDREVVTALGAALDALASGGGSGSGSGSGRVWRQPERDVARLCAHALAGTGLPEAIPPLSRWLAAVDDPGLLRTAAVALCRTRRAEAREALLVARPRLVRHDIWRSLAVYIERFPADARDDAPAKTAEMALARAIWHSSRRDFRRALAAFQQALAMQPSEGAHIGVARSLGQLGRADDALLAARAAVAFAPTQYRAHLELARALRRTRQPVAALAAFTRAQQLAPHVASIYAERARLLREEGDLKPALANLDRAIERAPTSARYHAMRADLRRLLGDIRGAFQDANRALKLQPNNVQALCHKAALLLQLGRLAEARAACDSAIALAPRVAHAYTLRARVLMAQRRIDEAERDVLRAAALAPGEALIGALQAAVQRARGDREGAVATLARAATRAVDPAPYLITRSQILQELRRFEEARADLDQAVKLVPRNPDVWSERARLRYDLRDAQGAHDDSTTSLSLRPSAFAHHVRAKARYQLRNLAGARADHDAAVRLAPSSITYRWARGLFFRRTGDLTRALEDYNHALVLGAISTNKLSKVDKARYLASRAYLHEKRQDWAMARHDYRGSVRFDPSRWKVWFNLAKAARKLGDNAGARAALDGAIKAAPPGERARLRAMRDEIPN